MKKINFVLICIFSIMILSCNQLTDSNSNLNSGSEAHNLVISLAQERMFSPSFDTPEMKWDISLCKIIDGKEENTDKKAIKSPESIWTFLNLEKGKYVVNILGYVETPIESETIIEEKRFTGSAPVTIGNELTTRLVVPVSAVKNTESGAKGTGGVNISMEISPEINRILNNIYYHGDNDSHFYIVLMDLETQSQYWSVVDFQYLKTLIEQNKGDFIAPEFCKLPETNSFSPALPCGNYKLSFRLEYDNNMDVLLNDPNVEIGYNTETNIEIKVSDYKLKDVLDFIYVNNNGSGEGATYSTPKAFKNINDSDAYAKVYYIMENINSADNASFGTYCTLKSFGKNPVAIKGSTNGFSFNSLYLDNLILEGKISLQNAYIKGPLTLDCKLYVPENYGENTCYLIAEKIIVGKNFSGTLTIHPKENTEQIWEEGDKIVDFAPGTTQLPADANLLVYDSLYNLFYVDSDGTLSKHKENNVEISQNPFNLAFTPAPEGTGTPAFEETGNMCIKIENFDDYIDVNTGLKNGVSVDWYLNDQKVTGLDLVSSNKVFQIFPLGNLKVQSTDGSLVPATIYMRDNILTAYIKINDMIFNTSISFNKKN